MNIDQVIDPLFIGKFLLNDKFDEDNSEPLVIFKHSCDDSIYQRTESIVYLITENKKIIKIGQTEGEGGMKACIDHYTIRAIKDDPGPSRFNSHLEIYKKLKNDNSLLEIYALYNDRVEKFKINTLLGKQELKNLRINAKDSETLCRAQIKKIDKKLPIWNLQERKKEYETESKQLYAIWKKIRADKKNKVDVKERIKLFRSRAKNYYLV